ncbi:MAG: HupE/UreJ family protein [Pseudomonadota bacterium]
MTGLSQRALNLAVALTPLLFLTFAFSFKEDSNSGFLSGFLHPLLGFDHFLAMLAVGLLSVQIGGRAVWSVPLVFLVFLAVGGGLGLAGLPVPQVEGATAFSVFGLGLLIAFSTTVPIGLAMPMVGVFALIHGHTHGMEIPSLAEPGLYIAGFLSASAVLHMAGVGLGMLHKSNIERVRIGAGCAAIGMLMLLWTYSII